MEQSKGNDAELHGIGWQSKVKRESIWVLIGFTLYSNGIALYALSEVSSMRKMPIGIDDFEDIITQNFYYIDKTGMIKELLENRSKVNLFTRPRRFGKSLNMSMLRRFFEMGADQRLFDGLHISEEETLCDEHLGRYPVISVTLKQVTGNSLEEATANLWEQVTYAADRYSFLAKSEKLTHWDKKNLHDLRVGKGNLYTSLKLLSDILYKHYGQKVIILIDEYDAPPQKAYKKDYYEKLVDIIHQWLEYALKSNESLFFGVLAGCMRIPYSGTSADGSDATTGKKSWFSDLDNPKIYTLVDDACGEWLGFTNQEVSKLLDDYGLNQYYETTKNWYDGYQIGATNIYCPWDVINWCNQLLTSSDRIPRNYWANVGENSIIYRFVKEADKYDLEVLAKGGCVAKRLLFEQTYKDIESNMDNLWSVLFTAGYLTQRGRNEDGTYRLAIPNKEVRQVFATQIEKWFMKEMEGGLQEMYLAFGSGDALKVESCINACLKESISFMDGGNTEEQKESSYHMLLLGMLKGCRSWIVKSNREACTRTFTEGSGASNGGKERADIILINRIKSEGIVIEVKHTNDADKLEAKARKACEQINNMEYKDFFLGFHINSIKGYGIAFSGKQCKVLSV